MNKFLQFPIVRIITAILFVSVGVAVGQIILNLVLSIFSITDPGIANILAFVIVTPIAYYAYSLYVRLVEKRPLTELGFANAWQEFGIGFLIGFGLFAAIIVILALMGFYRIHGIEFVVISFIGALLGAFVSALAQEMIFRGAIYRIVEGWLGTWWALGISALLFGFIHLSGEGTTILSALSIALQAGIVLAAVYTLTHRLWMALGLHMAWDFANDGVFGVGVAGQSGESLKGLVQAILKGPNLFTGGKLGVEASVISLVVVFIAGFLILRKAQQNGMFISGKR